MVTLEIYMEVWYNNDTTCEDALAELQNEEWVHSMGWEYVFHEGIGNGVYSPKEGIVAVFDEDDLPYYHGYSLYHYNPKAWKSTENGEWDKVYEGNNGENYEVEPY